MLSSQKTSALTSIRSRFSLITGLMLLVLLFSVYVGGRYIVVQMIRQTEENMQMVGDDIKRLVHAELRRLNLQASRLADHASSEEDNRLADSLRRACLSSGSDTTPVHLALFAAEDGRLIKGYACSGGQDPDEVDAEALSPYLAKDSALLTALRNGKPVPGMIVYQGSLYFFSARPVLTPESRVRGFLMIGSQVQSATFVNQVTEITPGMHVKLDPFGSRSAAGAHAVKMRKTPSTVVNDMLTFASGGSWHLGDNAFEIVIPVTDVLGQKVTALTVRMPGSFTARASLALGWLTCFIAAVGIVFVIPIFWIQSRLILNPLCTLARQIREIGEHHLDGACPAINWPHNDEFGILARSVNEMIGALALKTRQNEQGEQSQRALIAGMPDGLCVFDAQGRLVSLRKQPDYALPIPGLVTGQPLSPPIFPESDCEAFRRILGEAFRSDRTQMMMLCCREADGSYRHFETRISRMDEGQAVVVLRDVTKEWREREAREHVEAHLAKVQKMESLGTMAAGIAHDFNNILAIIQNTVEFTWEQPDGAEGEALRTIRQATDKGAALTRELMTYAGHTRTEFKCQDPNEMIRELENLMSGVVAQNVILDFKLASNLPPVAADPHQFWKVMINLLKNASEAFNGASGRITVSTGLLTLTRQSAADFFSTRPLPLERGLLVQIEDTGPGIHPDVIDRIFEPFVSTKAVGRGLGLATVFGIVDVHNGGIAIRSELGKGTCFRIWLPVVKQPPPPSDASETQSGALGGPLAVLDPYTAVSGGTDARPLVLLVEDDPAILRTTCMVLRSLGIEPLAAASQREAQMLFSQYADAIRLLLLDAQVGSLDNVRLLSILRLSRPDIPTVILSGHAEERIRAMFATEHYNAFLGKPYTRDELKAVLQNFIASS
jgi:signal transduction histidine kinase/HAMP domain-containing protein